MNKRELQKKLNQPYSQDNWKEVVDFVFPNVSLFSSPELIYLDNEKVEGFYQIGYVRLNDGKTLALFELKLKENVNIIRNRVELNTIVSQYIDQEKFHGVLSIFEQGKDDYRFTFSARASEFDEDEGDFKTKKTDTKRFTYVLGKNESCRTAAERFYQLSEKKDEADIKAIEHAFSVETLSKNFFKEYKQQYELFVDYLTNTPSYYTAVFNNEDKAIRDWVKLLLGRLVFIKFVQKKGWLGVPANEAGWQNGNYRFLEDSFENFEHQDNFYSQFLNPLFFDGFDAPNRPNDVFELTGSKIPFLSGGLFDNEDPKTKTINFPKAYFEGLFEFLEKYNFTIDENDLTMDKEVGIDPEMLGHIFENLLEDNKDKGAFYTPKEIVRYMCQESLKEYLKTYLQEHNQWSSNEAKQQELETALHNFITKKEAGHVIDLDATLAQALKDVKICDPAIGSGAFPMGLLNEIFQLVHKLYDASPDKVGAIWEMDTWQPDAVKLNIIQQSIYGVDIEKGAVEIARLRFWLSLVVDSDEPHALPHLDYKIVVGDSLVSKLEDTIIDIDWDLKPKDTQTDIFGNEGKISQKRELIKEITELQKQIFDPESDDDALSLKIRNKKIDLLILQLEIMIDEDGVIDKPQGNSRQLKAMTEKWLQTKGWKQQIQRLKQMKKGSKTPLDFFDWKLDFPEIMNPEINASNGFDIVIGNPPYLGERKNKDVFYNVQKSKNGKYYLGRMDYFYFFFHVGIDLLKQKGALTFITTNYFVTAMGAKRLRTDLKSRTDLIKLINFNESKIFDSAYGQHNSIVLLRKEKNKRICESRLSKLNKYLTSSELINILQYEDPKLVDINSIEQENLWDGKENYLRFKGTYSSKSQDLINTVLHKIKAKSNYLLNDICKPLIGLESSLDKIYVLHKDELREIINHKKELELIKPLFKSSDIKKYLPNQTTDLRIFYLHESIKDIRQYHQIYQYLKDNEEIIKKRKGANLRGAYKRGNWWVLNTPRLDMDFSSEKLVTPYRTKELRFAFSDRDWYASRDVYYIIKRKEETDLKYILGLLNSKLYYSWYYHRGKRKGNMLELYATPLKQTPVFYSMCSITLKISQLVEEIILHLKSNQTKEVKNIEQQIDNLIYKLYDLTYDEVLIIEPAFSERMSKEEYEALEVE